MQPVIPEHQTNSTEMTTPKPSSTLLSPMVTMMSWCRKKQLLAALKEEIDLENRPDAGEERA